MGYLIITTIIFLLVSVICNKNDNKKTTKEKARLYWLTINHQEGNEKKKMDSNFVVDENIYRNEDFIFYDDERLDDEEPIDNYEGGEFLEFT